MGMTTDLDQWQQISLATDLRLTDAFSMLFEREDPDLDFLAWLLRYAYVTGYWDALSEPDRGQLCRDLGYPVPKRRTT